MTDSDETTSPDATVKVSRDLGAILDLTAMFADQAEHKANDRDYLPGGTAAVSAAPAANFEAWSNLISAAERGSLLPHGHPLRMPYPEHVIDEDDDDRQPILVTLEWWSERWRVALNLESDRRATVSSEVNFLRRKEVMDWAQTDAVEFARFARDIRAARVRLENAMSAGRRAETTRVPCSQSGCPTKSRLIKVYAYGIHPDGWKCPGCKHRYDEDEFRKAQAKQLRSDGAQRYVTVQDALGMLKAQGRSERTVRKWFERCLVDAYCDPKTHEVWAWWPDLWRLHLSTPTKRRGGLKSTPKEMSA